MENGENKVPVLLKDLGMLFPTETSKRKARYGMYICPYCNIAFKTLHQDIKTGHTKSCGCHKENTTKTHDLSNNKFYQTWKGMMNRVYNKQHRSYKNYGARGITVCQDWHDIATFIKWAEENYVEGTTLDRRDNSNGYSPENCRWANATTQNLNKRIQTNNTSGYRGISWSKQKNKWKADISIHKKTKTIGLYATALEAAEARDKFIANNNLPNKPSL